MKVLNNLLSLKMKEESANAKPGGDSPDNDTLMQLLKEKAKELKQSQKKLKKVEDKFVEMHKS